MMQLERNFYFIFFLKKSEKINLKLNFNVIDLHKFSDLTSKILKNSNYIHLNNKMLVFHSIKLVFHNNNHNIEMQRVHSAVNSPGLRVKNQLLNNSAGVRRNCGKERYILLFKLQIKQLI